MPIQEFPEGVDPEEFKRLLETHARVVVFLWTEWCVSCKRTHATVERVARALPDITILSINLGAARWIQTRIKVAGVPTFLFFAEGTQVFRATGEFDAGLVTRKIQEKFDLDPVS